MSFRFVSVLGGGRIPNGTYYSVAALQRSKRPVRRLLFLQFARISNKARQRDQVYGLNGFIKHTARVG